MLPQEMDQEFECEEYKNTFNTKVQLEMHIQTRHVSSIADHIFQKFKSKILPSEAIQLCFQVQE